MYHTYIIQSEKDKNLYVGITNNLEERLRCHNCGRVKSTKFRTPFKLIYFETFPTRVEARQRERFLKSYKGSREKLTIIDNCGIV